MRCPNCGWVNEDGELTCKKCNYRLDGSIGADEEPSRESQQSNFSTSDGLKGTIAGSQMVRESWDEEDNSQQSPRRTSDQTSSRDSSRTTPMPEDEGFDDSEWGVDEEPSSENKGWRPSPEPNDEPPIAGDNTGSKGKSTGRQRPNFKGTIDPTRQRIVHQGFSLKPVAKEGESDRAPLSFTGEQVFLNRANLDPDNYSITSREQALIENVNGA
ncbi:MAG: zinc ribbon domain-containing protein, partial [Bacteroidota bacterium]